MDRSLFAAITVAALARGTVITTIISDLLPPNCVPVLHALFNFRLRGEVFHLTCKGIDAVVKSRNDGAGVDG